jgi:hypothetical protein
MQKTLQNAIQLNRISFHDQSYLPINLTTSWTIFVQFFWNLQLILESSNLSKQFLVFETVGKHEENLMLDLIDLERPSASELLEWSPKTYALQVPNKWWSSKSVGFREVFLHLSFVAVDWILAMVMIKFHWCFTLICRQKNAFRKRFLMQISRLKRAEGLKCLRNEVRFCSLFWQLSA